MTNSNARLINCFSNVFPDLRPEQIPGANAASLAAWDSVAHITLLSAISEEFGTELDFEDFEKLTSFAMISEYLEHHAQKSLRPS